VRAAYFFDADLPLRTGQIKASVVSFQKASDSGESLKLKNHGYREP
jgi:hypothetical protein